MSSPESHDYHEKIEINPMLNEELIKLLVSDEGKKYFEGKKGELQCMDGRINGGDGLAGSGILLDRDPNTNLPIKKYMDIFRKRVEEGKLTKICWHPECGAAKLFLKMNGNENPTPEQMIEAARDFSTRLAEALNIPVEESQHEEADHNEQGIYIDSTDKFTETPKGAKKLPNGFVLSPEYTEKDWNYHLKEIEVAIGISFGDHGPGAEAFSPEHKYFIMFLKEPKKPDYFEGFKTQIEDLIDKKFKQYKNLIEIKDVNPKL